MCEYKLANAMPDWSDSHRPPGLRGFSIRVTVLPIVFLRRVVEKFHFYKLLRGVRIDSILSR